MPDGFHAKYIYGPYFEKIEKDSMGKIKIETHWNGELAGVKDAYSSAANGTIDIVEFMPPETPGIFLIDEIFSFSTWDSNCWKLSQAYYDLTQMFPELKNEFKDTHLLGQWIMYERGIGSTKKPLRSFEDFKGVKMLSSGKWFAARVEKLGSVPVTVPPPDMYPDLQKGIIDAGPAVNFTLEESKLGEVYNYITDLAFPPSVWDLTMSLKAWNSLSPELQKVFDDATPWFEEFVDKIQLQVNQEKYQSALVNYPHIEWINLSDEDFFKMNQADASVRSDSQYGICQGQAGCFKLFP
jgi:TRAP-type C4-dicarboxylate transport system substrate-binding protein